MLLIVYLWHANQSSLEPNHFDRDANREMAETAMVAQSKRSHCGFFIAIERVHKGHDFIAKSAFSLIVLEGSDRLPKSSGKLSLINEGSSFSLDIHSYEQFFVALG